MNDGPEGFLVRAPRWDEIEGVLALMRECEEAEEGEAELTLDDLRGHWQRARFELERDARVVVAGDGRLAGYVDLWERVAKDRFAAVGRVRPAFVGHGIGTFLVRKAEARAREAAEGHQATVSQVIFHENEDAVRLLVAEGYTPEQHYWRMVIDVTAAAREPERPQGIKIRKLAPGDEREIWQVVQESFSENEGFSPQLFEEWASFMLERESFDPSMYFVADADGEIAGVALCPRYEGWGWVRQVAVRREWRRKGVGRALMQAAFAEFGRRGYERVGLVVDSYNRTGARQFYESLGMTVERQHDRYEKNLEPGT